METNKRIVIKINKKYNNNLKKSKNKIKNNKWIIFNKKNNNKNNSINKIIKILNLKIIKRKITIKNSKIDQVLKEKKFYLDY